MPERPPFIATRFRATRAGKRVKDVLVRLGKPRRIARDEWACEVEVTGIVKRTRVPGGTALQALCIALEFVGDSIYAARNRGLTLEFETGDAVPLQAYFRLREWRRRLARRSRHRHKPTR